MTRSRTAQLALDQYRRSTRRSDESREHALRELKRRIAAGECPAAVLQAPAAPQPRPGYVRMKLPLTAAAVTGLGALALTIIALPQRADDRARPVASKSIPKSAGPLT